MDKLNIDSNTVSDVEVKKIVSRLKEKFSSTDLSLLKATPKSEKSISSVDFKNLNKEN